MQWEGWSAFFYMGGYAFYVWLSFGSTLLCVIWEVVALRKRNTEALQLSQARSSKLLAEG